MMHTKSGEGRAGIHGDEREAGRERMDKKAKITPGKKSGRTESERRWKEEGEQKARKEREKTKTADQRFFAHSH